MASPTEGKDRIETLDVLRGFSLLGILLLNIVVFGLQYSAFSNPGFDLAGSSGANLYVWDWAEIFAEGSLRGLFSILFGAGVLLFLTGGREKSAGFWYRCTGLLALFGLFDSYVLLWSGDILVTYALAGGLLYWVRNVRSSVLPVWATLMMFVVSFSYVVIPWGL